MSSNIKIAPSLLSADLSDLKNEILKIEDAGADLLHVDVMDGHFVPNLTWGMPVVKTMKTCARLPLDVHLMIEKPEKYLQEFIKAGANILTIHVESTQQVAENLKLIRSQNVKAGITLKPATPLEQILPYLNLVDLVLVMTVEPGFGGQSFMQDQLSKVSTLVKERQKQNLNFVIEVDGGINPETAKACRQAGAEILVAGSAVFQNPRTRENYEKNINRLKA